MNHAEYEQTMRRQSATATLVECRRTGITVERKPLMLADERRMKRVVNLIACETLAAYQRQRDAGHGEGESAARAINIVRAQFAVGLAFSEAEGGGA